VTSGVQNAVAEGGVTPGIIENVSSGIDASITTAPPKPPPPPPYQPKVFDYNAPFEVLNPAMQEAASKGMYTQFLAANKAPIEAMQSLAANDPQTYQLWNEATTQANTANQNALNAAKGRPAISAPTSFTQPTLPTSVNTVQPNPFQQYSSADLSGAARSPSQLTWQSVNAQNQAAIDLANKTIGQDTLTAFDKAGVTAKEFQYSQLQDAAVRNQRLIDIYKGMDPATMSAADKAQLQQALDAQTKITGLMDKIGAPAQPTTVATAKPDLVMPSLSPVNPPAPSVISPTFNTASTTFTPPATPAQPIAPPSTTVAPGTFSPLDPTTIAHEGGTLTGGGSPLGSPGAQSPFSPTTVNAPGTGPVGASDVARYLDTLYAEARPVLPSAPAPAPSSPLTVTVPATPPPPPPVPSTPVFAGIPATGGEVILPTPEVVTPIQSATTTESGFTFPKLSASNIFQGALLMSALGGLGGAEVPPQQAPATSTGTTGTPAPASDRAFLNPDIALTYGERPESPFYKPAAAKGGYFDADAYFAEGGLVAPPKPPVQPTVAAYPTMAYTDGQGLVGAVSAPPALTPYEMFGSDAPHASPMAPAPAAAAPTMTPDSPLLAMRNVNATPVAAPISQNPNLGYSIGMSPLSRLKG